MDFDLEIDKLTQSIEDSKTGERYSTDILPFTKQDLLQTSKKNGWKFNLKKELSDTSKEVYKLILSTQPDIIQGIISITIQSGYIFMNLIESAPFNIGKNKLYLGVPGNLVSYICKMSFLKGFDGYVAFDAKTVLIAHYQETLGAFCAGGQRMIIDNSAAILLVNKYFPDFFNDNYLRL